jgi:hypothetical protein
MRPPKTLRLESRAKRKENSEGENKNPELIPAEIIEDAGDVVPVRVLNMPNAAESKLVYRGKAYEENHWRRSAELIDGFEWDGNGFCWNRTRRLIHRFIASPGELRPCWVGEHKQGPRRS